MADICNYKIIAKGKKNACFAFMHSMNRYDDFDIIEEKGTEDDFYLLFENSCKYALDCYCEPQKNVQPVEIPEVFGENKEFESIEDFGECFIGCTAQDRSKMFNVEVFCNWIVDCYEDPDGGCYEHYLNGEEIFDDRPAELEFEDYSCCDEYDDYDLYNEEDEEDEEDEDNE